MEFRFVSLIQDLFVTILLSSRERSFPIRIRRGCRICIGAFPSDLNPDGFPFGSDLFDLHHHRGQDHDSSFSKLRKDLQTQTWDPGDLNYKSENGGLHTEVSYYGGHTYGNLFEIVSEICILFLPRPMTFGILFYLLFLSFGIGGLLLTFKTRDFNLGFEDVTTIPLSDQFDTQTRTFVLPYRHVFVVITNKKSFPETLWCFHKAMVLMYTSDIGERTKMKKEIVSFSGYREKRIMDINKHQWVGCYRRHDPETFQATYQSFLSIKVMRKAFRSFIYRMIACYECMKRGLNRFILLPVRLLLESRVTSTFSSKLGFNFLYLFQRLYLNGFMYHVSCKTFMK